jgi:hypothetical protein
MIVENCRESLISLSVGLQLLPIDASLLDRKVILLPRLQYLSIENYSSPLFLGLLMREHLRFRHTAKPRGSEGLLVLYTKTPKLSFSSSSRTVLISPSFLKFAK